MWGLDPVENPVEHSPPPVLQVDAPEPGADVDPDLTAPSAAEPAVVVGPWAAVNVAGDEDALTFLSLPDAAVEASPAALPQPTRQLESAARISSLALDQMQAESALPAIVAEISQTSGFPIVVVERYDEARQMMRFVAGTGVPAVGPGTTFEVSLDQALSRFAVRGGEPVIQFPNVDEAAETPLVELGIGTFVCVPIRAGTRVAGALSLSHPERVEGAETLLLWLSTVANVLAAVLLRAPEPRDEFLSIAAHELQTPVAALGAYAQLLARRLGRDGADPRQVRDDFEVLTEQTTRLSRLVNQLLDVSRLESGKFRMDLQRCDLAALVRRAMATTQTLTDRHVLRLKAPARLPATIDPTRIEQVLTNLLNNAVRYSPDGGPIEVEVGSRSEDTLYVAVRDHGIGIAAVDRERIFDRLFQAQAGSNGGMGLGLYISAQIVQQHGGRLEVEAPDDGGTRLVLTLPQGSRD